MDLVSAAEEREAELRGIFAQFDADRDGASYPSIIIREGPAGVCVIMSDQT